jgi:hypothetical protein
MSVNVYIEAVFRILAFVRDAPEFDSPRYITLVPFVRKPSNGSGKLPHTGQR